MISLFTRSKPKINLILALFFSMVTVIPAQPVSGTLVAWGRNDFGQAAAPAGLTNVVTMSVGLSHSLALTDDGVLMGWPTFWATPGYDNVVALAAGQSQSLVLDSNGTVTDINGPPVPDGLTNVSAISANAGYSLALRGDGTVVSWGLGWNNIEFLTLNPPADLTNAVAIAAGQAHGVALRRDGKVVTWGDNTYGQTNMPATLTNVVAITANQYKSLALTADGTLISWGQVAPPPAQTNVVAIASGAFHDIALLGDGRIIGWGGDSYGVIQVPVGLTNAIAIAAGGWNNAALANNGNFSFASRQPLAQTMYSGSQFTLKAAIAGFPVSTYQWRFNGTNLAGTTQGMLVLSNISPTSTGDYSVVVSNIHGSFISSNVALTVMTSPPLVTSQSSDQSFAPETNASLYVSAGGSLPIQYQWRLNGTNLVGATNSVLRFPNLQVTNRGAYDVVLSNSYGATNSTSVRLHVLDLDEALNATNLIWVTSGDAAWFSQGTQTHGDLAAARSGVLVSSNQQSVLQTMVTGPATMSFWWKIDAALGNDHLAISVGGIEQARIPGTTGWEQQTVYLGAGPQTLQWVYTKQDNLEGAGWLDQVSLQYESTPPFITLNPTNLVVIVGSNATLNAAALGTPPLSRQWQFNQTNLDDATNASLTLASVQFPHEGSYALLVSNAFGATNTMAINLNVVDFTEALNATNLTWSSDGNSPWWPQTAVTHDGVAALQSGSIAASQQSSVQTTVAGPGTLSFWWKISSETNNDFASFSVDGVEQARISGTVNWQQKTLYLTPGGHSLTWNYSKNATLNRGSDAAWLDQIDYVEGATPAFIVVQPVDQVASLLSNATFSATAQGTPPLSFQWLFNDDPVAGATNAVLILTNLQATNTGNYRLFVTNDYGSALSSNAQLRFVNVYAWGAGRSNTFTLPNYGQSRVPSSLTNALALAAGGFHSLALRPGGKVTAWGWNNSGQTNVPSHLTNALALAAGMRHSLALRSNGTMTAWGDPIYSQTTVPASGTNVMAISAGWHHNLALKSNGTVIAWGAGTTRGNSPHLGQSIVPGGLSNVVAIAGGGYHSLALKRDGTVTAWGWNVSGQTNVPGFLSNIVAIAAGGSNSLALRRDGTVVVWGNNTYGQSNVPAGLSNVVGISAGAQHCLALKNDGTVVVWGNNSSGQTNAPSWLTNVVAIAGGYMHSLALLNDGSPYITRQPWSQTLLSGTTATFNMVVMGLPPFSYQWHRNGTNLIWATNATLILTNVPLTATGEYRCLVTNTMGTTLTLPAALTVLRSSPHFVHSQSGFQDDGSFRLELAGLSGHGPIIIFASTNLMDWQPILTNPPALGLLRVVDSTAANWSHRFYRIREQ